MNIEARFKVLNIKVVSDEEFNYSRISYSNTSCTLIFPFKCCDFLNSGDGYDILRSGVQKLTPKEGLHTRELRDKNIF